MKKLIATLVAGTLLASSLPALAGRPFDDRYDRHDRNDRKFRVERHDNHRPAPPRRYKSHATGLGVLGASLLLGGIILASETPRPAPVVFAPVSTPAVPVQPPQPMWYYCEASRAYYPYVNACPGGWRTVAATAYSY